MTADSGNVREGTTGEEAKPAAGLHVKQLVCVESKDGAGKCTLHRMRGKVWIRSGTIEGAHNVSMAGTGE